MKNLSLLMSSEVAARLGLSQARVIQLERTGKLKAVKTRRGWRLFDAKDVDRFAAERESKRRAVEAFCKGRDTDPNKAA